MLYELKETLKELEKIDNRLQKGAYKEGEIQEVIDDVSNFPQLIDEIEHHISSLQQSNKNNKSVIVGILSDLDGTLGHCTHHIENVREMIRQFYLQFTDEEISEILKQ